MSRAIKGALLTLILFIISNPPCIPQSRPEKDSIAGNYKPEIFTNGFIDIMNNGQVNASARFIRLYIGEPGRFAIPISLYSGVSANSFQNQTAPGGQRSNDHLVNGYINLLSGLVNISSDGVLYFNRAKKITKAGLLYHFGERVLTGYKTGSVTDPQAGKPCNFLNSFAAAGLYFQTAAWERSNTKNIGIFWLVARYHGCYSNPSQIKVFQPNINTNGAYTGYSLGFGVEINNLLNIKAIYYKYLKPPEIDYSLATYQFSFNYSFKN
jgi:hypothetical protein